MVLLVAVAATAAGAWRATINEQRRVAVRQSARAADLALADATNGLADLRATLYAYLSPGQGLEFWSARAQSALDAVRSKLLEVDPARPASAPPTELLDQIDRLAAVDERARGFLSDGQPLLAAEVVFADARAIIEAATQQLGTSRQDLARTASSVDVAITNEQSLIAGGILAVWIVATTLLVPVPRAAEATPARPDRLIGRDLDLNPTPVPLDPSSMPVATAPSSGQPGPGFDTVLLDSLAELCGEIASVSNVHDLESLAPRMAALIDAKGLVLWVPDAAGASLTPVVAHGYDQKTLERIGPVSVSADNLTASAFAERRPATRLASSHGAGALAVPLRTGAASVGVLTAEVAEGQDVHRAASVAGVIAAQLGALVPGPGVDRAAESTESTRAQA
jgi:hypothetical protein